MVIESTELFILVVKHYEKYDLVNLNITICTWLNAIFSDSVQNNMNFILVGEGVELVSQNSDNDIIVELTLTGYTWMVIKMKSYTFHLLLHTAM